MSPAGKTKKKSISWSLIVFTVALILSTSIKIASVWGNNFAFTIDQGRDLVDVRQMVVNFSPRLVGPTTSINGVLLGPFYYYFISIPFVLFGGHPAAIVYWQIFWFQFGAIFLWWVIRQKSDLAANLLGSIILLSPVSFYTARYFWNANAMPIFVLFFIAILLQTLWTKSKTWQILLGLVCGFSLQIEAAFGIIFFPFALLVVYLNHKKIKETTNIVLGFVITLIPQAIFELRHGFMMTKTMLAGLSGTSSVLGEKLDFHERYVQRIAVYLSAVRESSHLPFTYIKILLVVSVLFFIYLFLKKSLSKISTSLLQVTIGFLFISFVFYLFFSQNLKTWYTLGLPIFFSIIYSIIISELWRKNLATKLIASLILIFTFYHAIIAQTQYLASIRHNPSDDPSNLQNQIKSLNFVYSEAKNESFKVYIYLPSVYDYTYQYLFWWYGRKSFGYMPSELAYLPNQPEYIEEMYSFHKPKKTTSPNEPIFLIIEKPLDQKHYDDWIRNFSKYCQADEEQIVPKLKVLKLTTCPN